MARTYLSIFLLLTLLSCSEKEECTTPTPSISDPNEIFSYYSQPETETIFSESVSDSFKIFKSLPSEYHNDTTTNYPLLLVLDGNAYFESIVSELKLATLTQGLPKSIVIGMGYKNFWAMDSLRDRDYTFPAALLEDEFLISGGGENFKKFIDQELLPSLLKKYRVKKDQVVLMGHSLGGYFVLYHLLRSLEKQEYSIHHYIAASPALGYGHEYLWDTEKKLSALKNPLPASLYASTGSLERDSIPANDLFSKLTMQLERSHYPQARLKFVEFGNFDHMDAAMPGFMKGLIFVFEN